MNERYLIAGLGNPGREYENTRHNVGFMCIDALIRAHHLTTDQHKQSKAKIAQGIIVGRPVLLVKPQTFMNLSGSSIQGLAAYYKIPPQRMLVIYDDLDLPPGTLRIRPKGGSGGHRGMRDIIQRLGSQEFPRIRFGIGRPPDRMDPAAYVLRPFDRDEKTVIDPTIARVILAIEAWLTQGIDAAMNRFNGSSDDVAVREEQAQPNPATQQIPESSHPTDQNQTDQ